MAEAALARGDLGDSLLELVRELYPICRSITGDGVRQTLAAIRRLAPLEVHEVPSGTRVFDWTVPDEWNVREAWIRDLAGRTVVDFRRSRRAAARTTRHLYRAIGGDGDPKPVELACLWLLSFSDGEHDLVEIVDRSGLDFDVVARAADLLERHGLLEELPAGPRDVR